MTTRSALRTAAGGLAVALAATLLAAVPAAASSAPAATIESGGNPILADGSAYSADAAPLVVDDTLYVYAGHDEATEQQAAFVMNDYQVFATDDVESGVWDHYPENMVPGDVFSWATGRSAFAGQVTTGSDGRFYWYAPVEWENTSVPNRMAIGVAVSDGPTGPWTDAVGAPLLTWTDVFGSSSNGQEVIDPHVFTDTDGRVYLYWGSWGVARVVELDPSMTARKAGSTITTLSGLVLLRGTLGLQAQRHLLHDVRLETGRQRVHAVELPGMRGVRDGDQPARPVVLPGHHPGWDVGDDGAPVDHRVRRLVVPDVPHQGRGHGWPLPPLGRHRRAHLGR